MEKRRFCMLLYKLNETGRVHYEPIFKLTLNKRRKKKRSKLHQNKNLTNADPQFCSSERSPQSSEESQTNGLLMHLWFLQRNQFGSKQ